ncbi:MAG TPA: HAD-IA family hydrolase [Solirubrobacteraceae bacterium]|nr:HAD-IA family hydrolase [Solirubrobacteraceae bacterium]
MTTPSLIIFDCDGVLVDSEAISNGMLAQMLAEQGLELTLAESRARFQGHLLAEIVGISEALLGRPLPEGWIEEYVERRAAVFDAKLRPVAGAAELVERVRSSGVPSCVASQGSLAKTARSLALTGLAGYFAEDVRFSAEQVPRGKPHPDLFLHAAATLGVAPGECAVVEDTPSGVAAAVSAGMAVYGFCADSDERALRSAGAVTAPTLAQIGELLLAEAG